MANTTNLDLVKPLGTDRALISVINGNMDKIDAFAGETDDSLDAIQQGIAIVSVGDTHAAITSGQYVYVKGHNTLTEGLYTASSAIAENAALSSSNLTTASDALNTIESQISTLDGNKVNTSDIVNNLTTTASGKVLDARQGKALDDAKANDNAVVHLAGTETMTGEKIFASSCRIKNDAIDPRIVFNGSNNETGSASLYAADAGISGGAGFGNVQFQFFEYSPSSDGSSRTSRYERYDLPAVDTARSSSKVYEIITSKSGTFKPLYYKEYTGTTTQHGNLNVGIAHGSYAIVSVVGTDNDSVLIPYRYNATNWGVHCCSAQAGMAERVNESLTVKIWYTPIDGVPTL